MHEHSMELSFKRSVVHEFASAKHLPSTSNRSEKPHKREGKRADSKAFNSKRSIIMYPMDLCLNLLDE